MAIGVIGRQAVRKLFVPKPKSHKGENGLLTVVGGSVKYHGAPLFAMKTASHFVDLVFFYSPARLNYGVLARMKGGSGCFTTLQSEKELFDSVEKSDCVLVGNGLEVNLRNKRLVNGLLKKFKNKKFVLDAGALHLVDKRLLGKNVLVTPHELEFKALFGRRASVEEAVKQAGKWNCVVLLKKTRCFITDGKTMVQNKNGNQGMTKGGTGDVLAGLAAAFACKNPLFVSAQAASFVNGFAADLLVKRKGFYFNADDLAGEIPFAMKKLVGKNG
ncbi:MAG: NAD(P)H-hydrate dehydratase [Candidatus Micrarchaeota archaeon]